MPLVRFNESERATMLAALRHWQAAIAGPDRDSDQNESPDPKHIEGGRYAGFFLEEQPLSPNKIDELCERLNS